MTALVDNLLAEIRKEPSNDAPRQVLADHFEQVGETDRANLIHYQIERANLPWWDARALELELRERAILEKRGAEWRAELPTLDGVTWGSFTRGFVGKVAFDNVDAYETHRAACIGAAPIDRVVLRWPRAAKPPKLDALPGLRELTLVGAVMRPDDLKWLAKCPLLSTVSALNLVDSELRTGWAHLLKSPHLDQLEALRVPLHHIGNSGLSKLTKSSLPKLVELELSVGSDEQLGSGRRYAPAAITSKGILELQAWAGLAQIHTLDLSGAKLGVHGLLMLLASAQTRGLRRLCIRDIKDSDWEMDDSMTAFRNGPAGTLDELDITDNDLDPEGALYMAESKALRELKVLRIGNVKSKSFDRLARASWVRSLRVLACSEPALSHFLARVPERLHTLEIAPSSSPLSTVVNHLATDPPPGLLALDLRDSRIDDEGLRRLGELDLPKLAAVTLPRRRSSFSVEAVQAFAQSRLGAQLTSLDTGLSEIDRLPAPPPIEVGYGEYTPLRLL